MNEYKDNSKIDKEDKKIFIEDMDKKTQDASSEIEDVNDSKPSENNLRKCAVFKENNDMNSKLDRPFIYHAPTWEGAVLPSLSIPKKYQNKDIGDILMELDENETNLIVTDMGIHDPITKTFYTNSGDFDEVDSSSSDSMSSDEDTQTESLEFRHGKNSRKEACLNQSGDDDAVIPMHGVGDPQNIMSPLVLPPGFGTILEPKNNSKNIYHDTDVEFFYANPTIFHAWENSKRGTVEVQGNKIPIQMDHIDQNQNCRFKVMKITPKLKKTASVFKKMLIFMMIIMLSWGMFLFFTMPCHTDTEVASPIPEATLSDFWPNLNIENKMAACIHNDGLKFYNTSDSYSKVVFLPQPPNIKMTEIYSKCSKNFTLVIYSNEGSSFNFTFMDSSLFSPTGPLALGKLLNKNPVFNNNCSLSFFSGNESSLNFTLAKIMSLSPTASSVPVKLGFDIQSALEIFIISLSLLLIGVVLKRLFFKSTTRLMEGKIENNQKWKI